MCVAAKTHLERWCEKDGHRIAYVPYQSQEAEPWLGDLPRPSRPDVAFLVTEDGTVYRGLDAFVELLPHFEQGRFLSNLLKLPLMRPLARLVYRLLARHRYRWFGAVTPPDSA
jgi:predicted DCC family thiol-disulfide oxidoreductase YuxK